VLEELQKRPFARPLFWWIAGILLQVCFPLQQLSWLLFIVVAIFVTLSLFLAGRPSAMSYQYRWVWGMVITCCLLFLSIKTTYIAEQQMSAPRSSGWLEEQAKVAQSKMVSRLDSLHLSDDEKSVLATLTINYRKALSREARNKFTTTGVAHILSVSGYHVGIVGGLLAFLFSVFPAFTYIAGLESPAVRAAMMFSIYLTGQVLKLNPERYNTLAATAFCMLVYNPLYLFDIGFQLSFTAVFFLLYLQPKLYRMFELRNAVIKSFWGIVTVTVAAQTGTIFLSCYYFGATSTVFLFTNLLLSLLATLLIPLALIWMLLPQGIPGSGILQWAVEVSTKGMMEVVNRFAQIPGATVELRFDLITMLSAYAILGFVLYYFQTKRIKILFAALLLVLFLIGRQIFFTL